MDGPCCSPLPRVASIHDQGYRWACQSRAVKARPKQTVDLADVQPAQGSSLTDWQGLDDGERIYGASDPSRAVSDDSFSFENGCGGLKNLLTDPCFSGGQDLPATDELILRPEAGLLANAA
ncbi:hypothetical protein BKM78_02695 [Tessaracoccus sp. T2.5-30]|nr:hypothetical protein BKM78_02695 [Tessaracoccus sp. T2.5-30]